MFKNKINNRSFHTFLPLDFQKFEIFSEILITINHEDFTVSLKLHTKKVDYNKNDKNKLKLYLQ